jgi:mannose-6-phosphate isomerase-like protein (cupin superfamily)
MAYKVIDAADVEPTFRGVFRPIRENLGVEAFGVNQIDLPPDVEGFEHDESSTGQEEVYLFLSGSGVIRVGGDEQVEAKPGRYVFVPPGTSRQPVAGPDGLSWAVAGAAPHAEWRPELRAEGNSVGRRWVDPEELELVNGRVRRIRDALGVEAFGINQLTLKPDEEGFAHDEAAGAQEEVFLILEGSGRMRVDADEIELKPGRYVFVTPESKRQLVAGPDGLTWVCVGAPKRA